MNRLDELLAQEGVVILDGGLATELERRGADLRDPLWSAKLLVDAPELIRQVHLDYYMAGADIATTASYQASFEGFAQRGSDAAAAADCMRRSVALACEAREIFWADPIARAGRTYPLVAASVGPYGATLHDGSEYRGNYGLDVDALIAFHRPRLAVLAKAGADLLACETIPCRAEAVALARLLAEFPDVSAWMSFSCRDGMHDSQGEPLADCIDAVEDCSRIVAIGVNCTAPQYIAPLIEIAASRTSKPIVVYPNSGERFDASEMCWHGESTASTLADHAGEWFHLGARLIGGCCRTTPSDIRALRAWWSKSRG
ncbi:MAG TPA: homocysteine S-methyltransferase [Burkholderiaceae bacterium]|nr:homocysteine S-methyltransferase [Burkholderiaceae bacterium]